MDHLISPPDMNTQNLLDHTEVKLEVKEDLLKYFDNPPAALHFHDKIDVSAPTSYPVALVSSGMIKCGDASDSCDVVVKVETLQDQQTNDSVADNLVTVVDVVPGYQTAEPVGDSLGHIVVCKEEPDPVVEEEESDREDVVEPDNDIPSSPKLVEETSMVLEVFGEGGIALQNEGKVIQPRYVSAVDKLKRTQGKSKGKKGNGGAAGSSSSTGNMPVAEALAAVEKPEHNTSGRKRKGVKETGGRQKAVRGVKRRKKTLDNSKSPTVSGQPLQSARNAKATVQEQNCLGIKILDHSALSLTRVRRGRPCKKTLPVSLEKVPSSSPDTNKASKVRNVGSATGTPTNGNKQGRKAKASVEGDGYKRYKKGEVCEYKGKKVGRTVKGCAKSDKDSPVATQEDTPVPCKGKKRGRKSKASVKHETENGERCEVKESDVSTSVNQGEMQQNSCVKESNSIKGQRKAKKRGRKGKERKLVDTSSECGAEESDIVNEGVDSSDLIDKVTGTGEAGVQGETFKERIESPPELVDEGDASDRAENPVGQKDELSSDNLNHTPVKVFICEYCDEHVFEKRELFWAHLSQKHGELKPFKCSRCPKRFSTQKERLSHTRDENAKAEHAQLLACSKCGKTFPKRSKLIQHERVHTGEKPYVCEECGEAFRLTDQLNRHMEKHLPPGSKGVHPCPICSRVFNFEFKLKKHLEDHQKEGSKTCHICGKIFASSGTLFFHVKAHFTEGQTYDCPHCKAQYPRKKRLEFHMQNEKNKAKLTCKYCDHVSPCKGMVEAHLVTHTEYQSKKRFVCSYCGRRCQSIGKLAIHTVSHMPAEDPLTCCHCYTRFSRIKALKQHVKDKHFGSELPTPKVDEKRNIVREVLQSKKLYKKKESKYVYTLVMEPREKITPAADVKPKEEQETDK